jgi:hypothetical protein
MVTYALVFVSAIAGLVMIAAGVWGGSRLMSERRRVRIPLRYYAIVADDRQPSFCRREAHETAPLFKADSATLSFYATKDGKISVIPS